MEAGAAVLPEVAGGLVTVLWMPELVVRLAVFLVLSCVVVTWLLAVVGPVGARVARRAGSGARTLAHSLRLPRPTAGRL
jgi:hypothetical protein